MNVDQASKLPRLLQQLEQSGVVDLEDALVCHEALDTGNAIPDQISEFGHGGRIEVCNGHVKAVIDHGLPGSLLPPSCERVVQCASDRLQTVVDVRSCAPAGGGDLTGLKIVRGYGP